MNQSTKTDSTLSLMLESRKNCYRKTSIGILCWIQIWKINLKDLNQTFADEHYNVLDEIVCSTLDIIEEKLCVLEEQQ